jgi:hypothetical protein
VIRDIAALHTYSHKKEWVADSGDAGQKRGMHGGDAKDLYLTIPVGSVVYNKEYDKHYEFTEEGDFLVLRGGKGGLGNQNFKSSTNRTPEQFTKGELGEYGTFDIELKLIADAGLIGLPNAGKSSLLNSLTRAGAKVGDYAFKIAASSGLFFLSGMAEGLQAPENAMMPQRKSMRDAALQGVAQATVEQGREIVSNMNNKTIIEVKHSTPVIVIFDDGDSNE